MKVLFLDIDGVLNHEKTRERCLFYTGVDKTLAKRLTDWLADKDVKIVLSSTWRRFPEMHDHLHENGIHWIDVTPFIPDAPRGNEIATWLDENDVDYYAILDDNDDMDPVFTSFVQTDPNVGLTDENLKKVSQLLGYE